MEYKTLENKIRDLIKNGNEESAYVTLENAIRGLIGMPLMLRKKDSLVEPKKPHQPDITGRLVPQTKKKRVPDED